MIVDLNNEPGAGMLVRSLIYADSEVQRGRLLLTALDQDFGNGVLLARALLQPLVDGPNGPSAQRLLETMPDTLRA